MRFSGASLLLLGASSAVVLGEDTDAEEPPLGTYTPIYPVTDEVCVLCLLERMTSSHTPLPIHVGVDRLRPKGHLRYRFYWRLRR